MKKFLNVFLALIMAFSFVAISPKVFSEPAAVVAEAASKVKISATKKTLVKGQTYTLKISGTKKTVKWSSSKKSVAAVSSKGKVTAKAKGTATITAKVGTKKFTCKVTVETPKINKTAATIVKGKTTTLKISGTAQKVKWSTSKKTVATVSSAGVVTAKAVGNATITATLSSGKKYTCKIAVKLPDWSKTKAFNFYKDACVKIKETGEAGHTRKEWQELKSLDLGAAGNLLSGIVSGFMTSEKDADEFVSEKNTDDAIRRMCPCNCDITSVKSAKKTDLPNGNYKITIVMNDENSPAKDSNGIAAVSTGILYVEDVEDTVKNDSTVSKIVKRLDKCEINYTDYTIVAEMTKDGQFVDISQYGTGKLDATAKLALGSVSGGATLVFHSHWYGFNY